MTLRLVKFVLFLAIPVAVYSQATPESVFTLRTSTVWLDTGLDLQSGDVVQISASSSASSVPDRHAVPGSASCSAAGDRSVPTDSGLPLPSAAPGALIARLHDQGAAPLFVGETAQLHIEEPSHLYLGINSSGAAPCQGIFTVRVSHVTKDVPPAPSADNAPAAAESFGQTSNSQAASASGSAITPAQAVSPKSRGDELKSQLATAAQVFVQGQFGAPKSSTSSPSSATSNAAPSSQVATAATPAAASVLKVSSDPLDSDLRHHVDSLPRRVNDQLNNLGDMVNFILVGNEKDVQAALDTANWHVADKGNTNAVLNALRDTFDKKDYLAMPMSTLYLFGRPQDFGYEQAEPIAMVASRHHFRIWKAPFTYKGNEVWAGAGTHDIGFAKDKRNNGVTHKIDPAVDGERDNIGSSLQQASKSRKLIYYLPPDPVQDARNATGDGYHSDGRLLVIFLQ